MYFIGAFSRFSHKSIFQCYPEHVKPRPIETMAWDVPESVQVVLSIGAVLIILTLMWMIFAKLMGITSEQGRYIDIFLDIIIITMVNVIPFISGQVLPGVCREGRCLPR